MNLEIVGTDWIDTLLRLGLAALLGGIIGLDREATGKPAGFRTNILICVGAALLTQLSIDIAERWNRAYGTVGDPQRIAAQIVSGIGFLGAGTILQSKHGVRGLTTAATIWVVAAIGMAVGGGAYFLAISATAGVAATLVLLARFEAWLEPRTLEQKWVRVTFGNAADGLHKQAQTIVRQHHGRIHATDVERRDGGLTASFRVEARSRDFEGLVEDLLRVHDVTRASLE